MNLINKWALNYYLTQLVTTKDRYERSFISDETFRELRHQNLRWYENMIDYCEVCEKFQIEDKEDLEKLCKKYGASPKDYGYSLRYRHMRIDVFIDDYGQQEYAYFEVADKIYESSGGAYNIDAWEVFCDELNYQIEEAYVRGDLDTGELGCTLI